LSVLRSKRTRAWSRASLSARTARVSSRPASMRPCGFGMRGCGNRSADQLKGHAGLARRGSARIDVPSESPTRKLDLGAHTLNRARFCVMTPENYKRDQRTFSAPPVSSCPSKRSPIACRVGLPGSSRLAVPAHRLNGRTVESRRCRARSRLHRPHKAANQFLPRA